jgi:hypothetical protein
MVNPCFLKACCQSIYLTTPICLVQVTIQSLLLRAINKGHDPKPFPGLKDLFHVILVKKIEQVGIIRYLGP